MKFVKTIILAGIILLSAITALHAEATLWLFSSTGMQIIIPE